jgi:hypothetical protein
MPAITLITDFGTRDAYAACMKGVILRIAPNAHIIDASHDIERHNVLHGAYILRQLVEWYPPDTVHVAVVDPGVGTHRRIVVARTAGQHVIAPDNGLLSILQHDRMVEAVHVLENPDFMLPQVSHTFHGRDIMAPAAARLAGGARLPDVGPVTDHVEVLHLARPERRPDGSVSGRIIHRDAFGNLITNIIMDDLVPLIRANPASHVRLGDLDLGPIRRTYAEAERGQALALIGSDNHLEIAVNTGSAHDQLRPNPNSEITVG